MVKIAADESAMTTNMKFGRWPPPKQMFTSTPSGNERIMSFTKPTVGLPQAYIEIFDNPDLAAIKVQSGRLRLRENSVYLMVKWKHCSAEIYVNGVLVGSSENPEFSRRSFRIPPSNFKVIANDYTEKNLKAITRRRGLYEGVMKGSINHKVTLNHLFESLVDTTNDLNDAIVAVQEGKEFLLGG